MHIERTVTVRVRDGLHARPATHFVKLAKTFQSDVEVERSGRAANAKSSVKLMLLGVKEDDEILLKADGEDAAAAVDALAAFVATPEAGQENPNGGAAAEAPAPAAEPAATVATAPGGDAASPSGIPASEGTAFGPVFAFFPEVIADAPRALAPDEVEPEINRHRAAVNATARSLFDRKAAPDLTAEDAAIIDALIDVARDIDLMNDIHARIGTGLDAVTATLRAGQALSASFEEMEDAYIRARAEDVRSLTRNVALTLLGRKEVSLADMPDGAIVVADELGAWDLAKARLSSIGGIVCRKGTPTSHVSIMARAHGIPAVVGASVDEATLKAAARVAVDGRTGRIWVDPDAAAIAEIEASIAAEREARAALDAYRALEPHTRDGRRIEVAANLGSLREIDAAKANGAMGVGLFRTEFLFMERKALPSEDEQADVYTRLAQAFAPHPVVVRTLDVGGDKPVVGINFPKEENPFLGWRGVRMCLERQDVFKPQLKALLRAAVVGNIKVMVPMIADLDEIRAVRGLIADCRAELEAAGTPHADFELGIMMETPAAALLADAFARQVSFFSIGTNDLTQYIMAVDRLNPRVATLNRTEHPAVMKAIAMICDAAKEAGIWVGVCGEAASRPDLIPEFVRLGVTELSMSPVSIPRAKRCITEI